MIDSNFILMSAIVPIIATVLISVVVIVFVVLLMRRVFAMAAPNKELLTSGEDAQATVMSLWDTGTTVNDNPMVGLLLQVQSANRPAYQVQTTSLISRLATAQFQPGARLAVKIDPKNPQRVAIAGVLGAARA